MPSPLATCDRLIADAPPYECGEPLLWYITKSPMARYESFLVGFCPVCAERREVTAILPADCGIVTEGLGE